MKARTIYADLETAGVLDTQPDIQLAAIAIDDESGAELEVLECKIKFDPELASPEALQINHYTADAWADALPVSVVANRFSGFCSRHATIRMVSKAGKPYHVARLCGHNMATFDGPRLRRMFEKLRLFAPWDPRVRCTLQRALWHFDECPSLPRPENFKLATLCRHFEIPVHETHEALADVRLTIQLARALAKASAAKAA